MINGRRVFICSPLRGDVQTNQERARAYARMAALSGHIPITPHIYFTQFLEERVEHERELGIQMGIRLLSLCDELWVFGTDYTQGMQMEIDYWRVNCPTRPIHYHSAEVPAQMEIPC